MSFQRQQQTRLELEKQAGLWQQHLGQRQREPVQQHDLVQVGPAPRPSAQQHVGVSADAFQGGRRGKLVVYSERRH